MPDQTQPSFLRTCSDYYHNFISLVNKARGEPEIYQRICSATLSVFLLLNECKGKIHHAKFTMALSNSLAIIYCYGAAKLPGNYYYWVRASRIDIPELLKRLPTDVHRQQLKKPLQEFFQNMSRDDTSYHTLEEFKDHLTKRLEKQGKVSQQVIDDLKKIEIPVYSLDIVDKIINFCFGFVDLACIPIYFEEQWHIHLIPGLSQLAKKVGQYPLFKNVSAWDPVLAACSLGYGLSALKSAYQLKFGEDLTENKKSMLRFDLAAQATESALYLALTTIKSEKAKICLFSCSIGAKLIGAGMKLFKPAPDFSEEFNA